MIWSSSCQREFPRRSSRSRRGVMIACKMVPTCSDAQPAGRLCRPLPHPAPRGAETQVRPRPHTRAQTCPWPAAPRHRARNAFLRSVKPGV